MPYRLTTKINGYTHYWNRGEWKQYGQIKIFYAFKEAETVRQEQDNPDEVTIEPTLGPYKK